MKEFFKFTFAAVAGIMLSVFILIILGISIAVGAMVGSETETVVKNNSVVRLNLCGELTERSKTTDPLSILFGEEFDTCGLDDILASIQKAKENDQIRGILLEDGGMLAGFASVEEIRNALEDFKKSGKFIIAYADVYSQKFYYLASLADKILINPQGVLEWKGLASQPMFYKEAMEKLGVEMMIFKVGTYKSAVEPYTNTRMSEANREQVNAFLGSTWNKVTADVAKARNLTQERVKELAEESMLFNTTENLQQVGLVDTVVYKSDVEEYLKNYMQLEKKEKLSLLSLKEMINVKANSTATFGDKVVAVYYASGEIDGATSLMNNEEGINSKKMVKDLRKLQEDDEVAAVVIRVNSPGGSAFGSEQIWHAVMQLKAEKPVVISMGDYAASGGYYLSCGADCIVANPTTLTGSIGIFGMVPNFNKVAKNVGLSFDVVKTNEYADFGATTRPWSEGEKALMQRNIERGYDLFLTRCADGREKSKEEIDKIAQGRVWTGSKAKELGLVDELGDLDSAIEIAARLAEITDYTLKAYPKKKEMLEQLTETLSGVTRLKALLQLNQSNPIIKDFQKSDCLQARMPFDFNIN